MKKRGKSKRTPIIYPEAIKSIALYCIVLCVLSTWFEEEDDIIYYVKYR